MRDLVSYVPALQELLDSELYARLLHEAAESLGKHAEVSLHREDGLLITDLRHAEESYERVQIYGPFFHGKQDAVLEALVILIGLLATSRPFCWAGEVILRIESLDQVCWIVNLSGEDIRGGPEPLDQALSKMSCLGRGMASENLLSYFPDLKENLPDWEVEHIRSCCLSLVRRQDDHYLAIDLSLRGNGKILAETFRFKPGIARVSWGPCVATYRAHIVDFVRELAGRINKLMKTKLPGPVVTWWGPMEVAITPPGFLPTEYLF
jgi:hypothetical protein